MFHRLSLLSTLTAILLASCNADLADGNPCHALIHADCDRLARCNLLPAGVSDSSSCQDQLAGQEFNASCGYAAGDARTCASDLDNSGCTDLRPPASCSSAFSSVVDPLIWFSAPIVPVSSGGSSSSGGSGGKSSGGSGGAAIHLGGSGGAGGSAGFGAQSSGGSGGSSGTSQGGTGTNANDPGQAFVGTWTGTVSRSCSAATPSCAATQVAFTADVTEGGRGVLVATPGAYDSNDPPAPNDCAPASLAISGSIAETTTQSCVSASLGPVQFLDFRLQLVPPFSMSVTIESSQTTPFAYTLIYSGTLTQLE